MSKVSVLIPVYNVEKYIETAIKSIINQTYKNIEIVIVDDASTDGTFEIVNRLSLEYPSVKVLRNKENSGITTALNNGLPYCTGDFIARADGDDIQHPERIARQIDFLNKNEEYGVVGCWVKNIDEQGNETARCEYPTEYDDIISCIKYTSPILHIWLARKSVYNKLGGYRKTNPAEDYDFILRCLAYGIKVSNIPFYGSYIRLRSGSTMTESSLKQKIIFNYLKKMYSKNEINKETILNGMPDMQHYIIYQKLHTISIRYLKKAIEQKRTVAGMTYLLFSLISPYTVQDIFRRLMFRRYLNNKKAD
ncbi:glycosyltransferase family 2 protein [Enterobacter hormaechei]|uniref:glycosyltransferase family 2 protein n=1 Tax=Enterobacter hormaechei TaxID=158836 RepID=UPI00254D6A72|nr:glycosyltransferase family 2 protein [Enterobacter hormaechei]MDK7604627.1 glycosyltransferase family 2 protein [Enterobacter hormaechei]